LEHLDDHLRNAPRGVEYPHSVFATFATAIAQAEQQAPGAAAVLCFAAQFAPDAIPDELFRQPVENYAEVRPQLPEAATLDLRSAVSREVSLDEALGALDRLSLLPFAKSSSSYSLHRLVQLAARDLAGEASAWRECAVQAAESAFPEVEFGVWPQCARLLPHARAALDNLPDGSASLPAARLGERCAIYLWKRGQYRAAELLQRRVLAIEEKALGPLHTDFAVSLHNLGVFCRELGRYDEAEEIALRVLRVLEQSVGPDHAETARALNELGLVYHAEGRHHEAEPLYVRALAIREKALGKNTPQVARLLNNLARVYHDQRRFQEAAALYERTIAIYETRFGSDHPDLSVPVNNLAEAYAAQGRYAEAEPLRLRALAICEKADSDHPFVARVLLSLAEDYRKQERYREAQSLLERALAIQEKMLGPDHPYVADSLQELAVSYACQGSTAQARRLFARALSITERALGAEHVKTLAVRERLAALRE
jgi:tetratricopeptide (TPR) repeat protein